VGSKLLQTNLAASLPILKIKNHNNGDYYVHQITQFHHHPAGLLTSPGALAQEKTIRSVSGRLSVSHALTAHRNRGETIICGQIEVPKTGQAHRPLDYPHLRRQLSPARPFCDPVLFFTGGPAVPS